MPQSLIDRVRHQGGWAALPEGGFDLFAWLTAGVALSFLLPAWLRPITDPDYGWLVWLGDRILGGHVPRTNGFSWTAPDMAWVSHETLVGLIYAVAGTGAVVFLRGAIVSATALLMIGATHRPRCAPAGFLAFVWAILLIDYGRTERALSWGDAMLALVVALIANEKAARWRFALAAIAVGIWANVHGSFVVGVFIVAVIDWRWGIAAALLTLVNPYGWHLWELVVGYGAGTDVKGLLNQTITEWRRPDFGDPMTLLRFALLFGGGGLIVWTSGSRENGKWDWRNAWRPALIWLGLTALAFQHRRFIDIAGIALAPWLAVALERVLPPREGLRPWIQLAVALPILAFLARGYGLDREAYPDDLPFASLQDKRLWNDFTLGGYLGQHGVRVFWDGRNDCYPANVFSDGVLVERLEPGWRDVLERWRIDTVVTRKTTLATALTREGWRLAGKWGEVAIVTRGAR